MKGEVWLDIDPADPKDGIIDICKIKKDKWVVKRSTKKPLFRLKDYDNYRFVSNQPKWINPRDIKPKGLNQIVVIKNGLMGLLDAKTGKVLLPVQFSSIRGAGKDGLMRIKRGWQWGMCDMKGRLIIPVAYKTISKYSPYGRKLNTGRYVSRYNHETGVFSERIRIRVG